ncbi:hypothetical protein KL921_005419, partial [Ogataea angusta]
PYTRDRGASISSKPAPSLALHVRSETLTWESHALMPD